MAAGNRSAAVKLYRDLAAARPDELGIQLGYADFLEEQGRGDALALKLSGDTLEAALKKHPAHPQLIRRLFQHAQRAGDKPRQIALLDQLPADDPESVLLYASLSRSVFDAGDTAARDKVDQRFLQAMDSHPDSRALARAASEHFRDTGRTEQAIDILKRHAAAAPSSLELRTRLGILCFAAKRDAEGESALKEVLAIHPRQAIAHQSLAKFYRLRDQPDPARFHAGELLKIRGGSPAEFIKLADEWLAANEPKQARILLEKAVFDAPDNPELARKLAIATRRDPETRDAAARLFREAEATQPALAATEPAFLLRVRRGPDRRKARAKPPRSDCGRPSNPTRRKRRRKPPPPSAGWRCCGKPRSAIRTPRAPSASVRMPLIVKIHEGIRCCKRLAQVRVRH